MAASVVGATTAPPLQCGVFWFLHISKTGGTSVQEFLRGVAHQQRKWKFVNLEHQPCDKRLTSQNIMDWDHSPTWKAAQHELNRTTPYLLVHQHHCSPGFGAHLLPQLLQLKRSLRVRGCSLALGTVLREPTSWARSAIYFTRLRYEYMRNFVSSLSDYQVKFIMFGYSKNWPAPLSGSMATTDLAKRAAQTLAAFDLVGRTDNLSLFTSSVAKVIGVDPPELPHIFDSGALPAAAHPFELTESDMAFIQQHSVADAWLWEHTFHSSQSLAKAIVAFAPTYLGWKPS
jgi:hypothetical protein